MSINARDIAQRSIGCIGFSALAHTTLVVGLLLAPKSATDVGLSATNKQKLSEGDGAVEVIAPQNQEQAPAAAAPAKVEAEVATASIPTPPAPKAAEELPPPPPKKLAEVAPAKPVKTKVIVKAAPAPKLKTTKESDVMTETIDKNVELESLSPVISEEPMPPSSDDAEIATAPSTTPAQASDVKEDKASQESAPAASAPSAPEKAPEPQATNETKEVTPKKAVTSEEGTGQGGAGSSNTAAATTGAGNDDAQDSGSGSMGAGLGGGKVIEASLRKPLPGNQLPQYPRQDRLMRREGTSVVLGDVRHDGTVDNVRLERSAGSKEMDSAAIAAFKKWKFAPGAEATVRKSFQYALHGAEQVSYTGLKR